jgi:hypothetical protein
MTEQQITEAAERELRKCIEADMRRVVIRSPYTPGEWPPPTCPSCGATVTIPQVAEHVMTCGDLRRDVTE